MTNFALTGPAAAALLGWDGFNKDGWTALWCVPHEGSRASQTIRTRSRLQSTFLGEQEIAHPILILRHLGELADELARKRDNLTALERIEIAVEYVLYRKLVDLRSLRKAARYGRTSGDRLLLQVLLLRGNEPPAESYQEVRMLQLLRQWGIFAWRQVPVYENGKLVNRVDFVIPYDPKRPRPHALLSSIGLVLEVDSTEFHENRFDEDHQRQTTFDVLGIAYMTITPKQMTRSPERVRAAVERRFAAACKAQGVKNPLATITPQQQQITPQDRKSVAKRAS